MNGGGTQHVATVTLPAGLDVSLVSSPAPTTPLSVGLPATRQRKYNFSFREKELLVSLIERHGGVVESRTGDGVTIEQKVAAWADVQQRFNQMNGPAQERSVTELKKCYWNLKQKTKKALDAGREAAATGGSTKIDRVLWRIAQLAPEQFEGLLDLHCEVVDAVPEFESKAPNIGDKWDIAGQLSIKQDSVDLSDLEASNASRADSPERSRSAPSPSNEMEVYPVIPSDYLAVEMRSTSPQQQQTQQTPQQNQQTQQQAQQQNQHQQQAQHQPLPPQPSMVPTSQQAAHLATLAEQWRAAAGLWTPPGLPELHRLVNGGGAAHSQAAAAAAAALGQGLSALATSRPRPVPSVPEPAGAERRGTKRPAGDPETAELELRRLEHEYKMRLMRQEAEQMEARHALQMQVLEQQRAFWSEALARVRRGEPTMPFGM
ncbi:uncharacterized protein LOC122387298 [Amphibalanus amphitrite]|uniref:uncharacterized protein LOC122387298 n=1 Tax=Amphibalanus amphitrite TaxID=1232801 RepID=UPI001C921A93|nr:uncharacterized protein LOC122387298 [Amphibalanus amphitrite]